MEQKVIQIGDKTENIFKHKLDDSIKTVNEMLTAVI